MPCSQVRNKILVFRVELKSTTEINRRNTKEIKI